MRTTAQEKQKGFTIIEVLIVLSIAGLIMLIVFLAVPALRRSARNTERKNQVATYVGAINEFMQNNNNGKVPSIAADVTAINALSADGPIDEPTPAAVVTSAQTNNLTVDTMRIVAGAKCDTDGDSIDGPNRSFVVLYAIEDSSGGAVKQCLEG